MSKQRSEINRSSGNNYSRHEINLAYQQCKSEGRETSNGNIEKAANDIRHDWKDVSNDRTSIKGIDFRDYDDI